MDTETITKIIDLMKESDLTEFQIEEEGLKLRIKRGGGDIIQKNLGITTQVPLPPEATPGPTASTTTPAKDDANIHLIKSPMVGTFYHAASPESPAFIKIGDNVTNSSTVCIIEAMKIMNEIHAETTGSIVEILIENGQTVEFGQPLFKVKKG